MCLFRFKGHSCTDKCAVKMTRARPSPPAATEWKAFAANDVTQQQTALLRHCRGVISVPACGLFGKTSVGLAVCFCVYVSLTPSTKSTNFGSRYLVDGLSERDIIWQLDRGGLAIYQHADC